MTNFSHLKCYANKTNNCSTKISAEHFISDNILKGFEQNKTVKLTGLPWIENQTFNLLSRKSLVSNILCTNHNKDLSPYDSEAGNFHRCIADFDADFNNQTPINETRKFNGDFIEKWMLKTICGLIASNQIAVNSQRQNVVLKEKYVDLLFNNEEWPISWGLYFKLPENKQIHKFDCISVLPYTGNNEVKAAEFLFNNFVFNLSLGKPDKPELWGIHRVNKIHFTNGKVIKTIELEWNDLKYDKWVSLTRTTTTTQTPSDWKDWMKK